MVWVMWTPVEKFHEFQEVFKRMGWNITASWVWIKPDIIYDCPANEQINAVETCFVASFSTRRLREFSSSQGGPPQQRHAMSISTVTPLTSNAQGFPINVSEKPVQVALRLIDTYTRPGQNMLVIGTGSGSECIAGLHSGRKVWAVESNLAQ